MIKSFPFLSVSVTVLILIAVLFPGPALPDLNQSWIGLDKIVHFLMFLCWAVALHADFGIHSLRGFLAAGAACIAFSLGTETLQLFAEGRSFDLYDAVSDVSGFIVGLAFRNKLALAVSRFARKKAAEKRMS